MIKNFKDHAANERTYLAWVRTGVTVMVLGFFIEKFELFLESVRHIIGGKVKELEPSQSAEIISVVLVALGLLVISLGTVHYFQTKRAICEESEIRFSDMVLPVALSGFLILFGGMLLLSLMRLI